MKTNPYLFFNGNCEEALSFYGKTLGTKPEFMKVKGSPAEEHYPPDWKDKILHAHLPIGEHGAIMGSDGPGYKMPQGMRVVLHVEQHRRRRTHLQGVFRRRQSRYALEKTFFATKFGMLTDRFNIPWMIISE